MQTSSTTASTFYTDPSTARRGPDGNVEMEAVQDTRREEAVNMSRAPEEDHNSTQDEAKSNIFKQVKNVGKKGFSYLMYGGAAVSGLLAATSYFLLNITFLGHIFLAPALAFGYIGWNASRSSSGESYGLTEKPEDALQNFIQQPESIEDEHERARLKKSLQDISLMDRNSSKFQEMQYPLNRAKAFLLGHKDITANRDPHKSSSLLFEIDEMLSITSELLGQNGNQAAT